MIGKAYRNRSNKWIVLVTGGCEGAWEGIAVFFQGSHSSDWNYTVSSVGRFNRWMRATTHIEVPVEQFLEEYRKVVEADISLIEEFL